MESGQVKLVLFAHMVFERINLRGLWLRVSPELYSCFGRIIIRHCVSEFIIMVEGLLLGKIRTAFDDDVETAGHAESSPQKQKREFKVERVYQVNMVDLIAILFSLLFRTPQDMPGTGHMHHVACRACCYSKRTICDNIQPCQSNV